MGKPLTIDGYCTVKPEFGCDETGSKYLGWCGRSATLGGAPLTYLLYIEPSGHNNRTLSDVRLSFYHYYRPFCHAGTKKCPDLSVRCPGTRDAIWPDCVSCPPARLFGCMTVVQSVH
eukprot:scaffold57002_cov33-Attheya_sp.AAC.1